MPIVEKIQGGTRTREAHTYRNPTAHTMTIEIFEGPPPAGRHSEPNDANDWQSNVDRKPSRPNYFTRVVAPGASVELPAEYANAIHEVRDGVIVGGIAPLLVREIPTQTAKLHPSLIPRRSEVSFTPIDAADVGARVSSALAGDDDEPAIAKARARRAATR